MCSRASINWRSCQWVETARSFRNAACRLPGGTFCLELEVSGNYLKRGQIKAPFHYKKKGFYDILECRVLYSNIVDAVLVQSKK